MTTEQADPSVPVSYSAFRRQVKRSATVTITNRRRPWVSRTSPMVRSNERDLVTIARNLAGHEVESFVSWPKATGVRLVPGGVEFLHDGSIPIKVETETPGQFTGELIQPGEAWLVVTIP